MRGSKSTPGRRKDSVALSSATKSSSSRGFTKPAAMPSKSTCGPTRGIAHRRLRDALSRQTEPVGSPPRHRARDRRQPPARRTHRSHRRNAGRRHQVGAEVRPAEVAMEQRSLPTPWGWESSRLRVDGCSSYSALRSHAGRLSRSVAGPANREIKTRTNKAHERGVRLRWMLSRISLCFTSSASRLLRVAASSPTMRSA
jgi:hypothetical protein